MVQKKKTFKKCQTWLKHNKNGTKKSPKMILKTIKTVPKVKWSEDVKMTRIILDGKLAGIAFLPPFYINCFEICNYV